MLQTSGFPISSTYSSTVSRPQLLISPGSTGIMKFQTKSYFVNGKYCGINYKWLVQNIKRTEWGKETDSDIII